MKRIPVLRGYLDIDRGNLLVRVWCPHCERHHTHGWLATDGAGRKSHRWPHCEQYGQEQFPLGYRIGLGTYPVTKAHNKAVLARLTGPKAGR